MSFFLKKKLLKDRALGLVFSWRGGRRSSALALSLACISSVAAVLFFLFCIDVKLPALRAGEVVPPVEISYISDSHPQLKTLSQFSSPLPPSWQPIEDPVLNKRIFDQLSSDLLEQISPEVKLLKLDPLPLNTSLPAVTRNIEYLTRLRTPGGAKQPKQGKCAVKIELSDAALLERLPSSLLTEPEGLLWSDRGKQVKFSIIVNPQGTVEFCNPLGETSIVELERCLRNIRFKPIQGEATVAIAILTIVPKDP